KLPPLGHPVRGSREPILVAGNPEADARQDGEAVAGIANCEFQHDPSSFPGSWCGGVRTVTGRGSSPLLVSTFHQHASMIHNLGSVLQWESPYFGCCAPLYWGRPSATASDNHSPEIHQKKQREMG